MTRRGKFILAGCIVAHAILSWFSRAWCVGVSMAILDSGGTEAPLSLIGMCWAALIFSFPLAPLTQPFFGKLAASGLPESHPIYWLLVLVNSFLAVYIVFFVVRVLRKLLRSRQARFAHE
jgi:hypothetical protein